MPSRPGIRSLLLAPLMLAGCGDSLAPGALSGSYALQRVAGDPLPAVLATTPFGTILVLHETIRLELDGTGTRSTVSESIPHNIFLPREGPATFRSEIRWTITKGRIEIERKCGPLENCVPGAELVGVFSGHKLRLKWGPRLSGRAPLEYVEARASQ
jgi:hypothetical protein